MTSRGWKFRPREVELNYRERCPLRFFHEITAIYVSFLGGQKAPWASKSSGDVITLQVFVLNEEKTMTMKRVLLG
jgi:hypothetical protein